MNKLHEGPNDVLAALRAATKDQHALLDAQLPIGGAAPTLAAYQQHLTALRAWLLPMRDWLARFDDGPQAGGLVAVSARLALIAADLADLTDPTPTPTPARAPAHAQPPAPAAPASDAPAYRWGACYVIEGSQLGGAVLYRRLAVALQPHPLRYLAADSIAPGPRWAAFIAALRQAVHEPAAIAAACAGARDAFDAILAIHGLVAEHQP